MIPRRSTQRKYRPGLEPLESKQLLSGGLSTYGPPGLVQPPASLAPQVKQPLVCPCGIGTGIRIITS
jgi:hypothetical protein